MLLCRSSIIVNCWHIGNRRFRGQGFIARSLRIYFIITVTCQYDKYIMRRNWSEWKWIFIVVPHLFTLKSVNLFEQKQLLMLVGKDVFLTSLLEVIIKLLHKLQLCLCVFTLAVSCRHSNIPQRINDNHKTVCVCAWVCVVSNKHWIDKGRAVIEKTSTIENWIKANRALHKSISK